MFCLNPFLSLCQDSDVRHAVYALAHELYPGRFKPTITHCFLKLLVQHSLPHTCFTQNIDSLERSAGVPEEILVEAHGSFLRPALYRVLPRTPRRFVEAKHHINEAVTDTNFPWLGTGLNFWKRGVLGIRHRVGKHSTFRVAPTYSSATTSKWQDHTHEQREVGRGGSSLEIPEEAVKSRIEVYNALENRTEHKSRKSTGEADEGQDGFQKLRV
ncbi:hypothetical protein B0H14DRAFT_2559963 [Mycena olivaceomarginata]|nr:hypothetical protein B0H14DRAFT_2559963 [Mycena olivaceomarginata]